MIYVRAVNGSLYATPVLMFNAGFIRFDTETAELVVWDVEAEPEPTNVLVDVMTAEAIGSALIFSAHNQRAIPGTEPQEFRPAKSYTFGLCGRIPVPTTHEGIERYASRLKSHTVLDFRPGANDAQGLG